MAKTTSQIVAENKKKREEEQKIEASRNEIHKKQMTSVGDHAAKTAAVLKKAYASTKDTQRKSETNTALKRLQNAYGTTKKTAVDKLRDRQSTPRQRTEQDEAASSVAAAKRNTEQKEKELSDYREKIGYEWMDAAFKPVFEEEEKKKQAELTKAQAEQNAAVANFDRIQMNAMSEEDRALIDEYIRREDTASDPLATGTEAIVEHFVNQNTGIDEKRLKQLVETRRRELNAQRMQEVQRKAQQEVNNGWMSIGPWANLKTIPANLMSGLMGTMSTIHDLVNRDERYSGLDPNSMGNELNVYSGAVRGQTQQNIEGDGSSLARKGLATLYQAGMSFADTGARTLAGGALGLGTGFGATVAGLNTFSQTMADANARGASPEQAVALAVATAGIEALTEKYSLNNLIKISKSKGGVSLLLNLLRSGGVELSEEEASFALQLVADAAIMQEKSEYNQTVLELMAQGMTEEQAREQASWGLIREAGETALVSSIAGAFGGFSASAAAAYSQDGINATSQQAAQQPQTAQNPQDMNVDAQQEAAVQTAGEAPVKQQTPQEQYRAELADVGLVADFEGEPEHANPDYNQTSRKRVYSAMREGAKETGIPEFKKNKSNKGKIDESTSGVAPEQKVETEGQKPMEQGVRKTLGTETAADTEKAESAQQVGTPEVSVQDGQEIPDGMKGTGAAEQNFSGKAAYQDLLSDENAQRDRNTGARPVEVPKVDANGNRVTEFAGNVYSAKVTPDSTANAVESLIQDGKLGFDTRTNQQSLENARQAILDNGPDTIRREIASNAENNVIRDGDIEKAMVLYAAYANDPKMQDEASGLIVDMGKIANMSGRNLQMFSLMQRMTPEGQIMAVKKNVSRYIDDINRTRKGRKKVAYEIRQELENQYIYAKTDGEKQEALKAIYEDAASGIKPTLGEAWDAWRNLSMLGNALTHERNVGSTAAWQPFVEVKRDIGAAIEAVALRKKRDQRTKAILGFSENDRDLLRWARADAKTQSTQKLMEGSGRTGNEAANEIQKYRKLLPGPLDKLSKGNMDLMGAEDSIFKSHEYSRSLASFLKARGYTAQQLQNGEVPVGVLDQARQHAVQEAKKATFNDQNEFSKQFSNMLGPKANNPAILNVIKKANTPYLRTPANIVHRAYEYSPLSLGKTLMTAKSDIDSGRMSASDVIDRVSSGLTGTAAMGLGAALSAGIIPGVRLIAEPTEEEELEGAVPYSIEIGGKYYPAGWLAPAMIPLFTGARLNENLRRAKNEDGEINGWDVVQAVADSCAHSLDPILDLTTLSSLKRVLEEVGSYGEFSDKAVSLVVGSAMEYLAQGIPVLLGQLEKAFEPEKKSVYVNTDRSIEKTVKKTIGNATKRIPGIDLYQTTKLDDEGNPVTPEGNALTRAIDALFNPVTVSEKSIDPVIKEMARLNKTPDIDVKPKTVPKTVSYQDKNGNTHTDVRISEDQYQKWSAAQKKADYRITHELVSGTDFKNLTDLQKAKALELAQEYAVDQGKRAALDDYPDRSGWMAGIDGKEADAIIRKVNADTLDKAISDLTKAWKNGWDDSAKVKNLEDAYSTLDGMSKEAKKGALAESYDSVQDYAKARDAGVSTDIFADLYQKYRNIEESDLDTTAKAHEWATVLEKAVDYGTINEKQKDILRSNMGFRYSMTAETERFDGMIDAGIPTKKAKFVIDLLDGIAGTGSWDVEKKEYRVRDIDKLGAIASTGRLDEQEKDIVMKEYMPDYDPKDDKPDKTELKYDTIRGMGISAEEYVQLRRLYTDEKAKGGKGTKNRIIKGFCDDYGFELPVARKLYDIYYGSYFKK